jgi:hypothetical protein
MDKTEDSFSKPSRRQFLRRGVQGAWLFGLGSAFGLLANRAPADKPQALLGGRKLGKEFIYDVASLRKTNPKLVQYEETGHLLPGFKEVRRVAIGSNDQVYAAGDRAIHVLDKTGARLREIALAQPPRCLAIGNDGLLYVGMKDHVQVFGPDGVSKTQWASLGPRAVLTSLAVTDNDVFAADAGNRQIVRYNTAGLVLSRFGKKDTAKQAPGFIVPSPYFDLAIGLDGLLWVANPGRHKIEAYTYEGDFELSWGEPGAAIERFCGCCNPVNFALLPDGRFVTCEKGLARVKVYSVKGEFEGVVAGPELFPKHAENPNANPVGLDVAADSQGRVLVADPLANKVRIFSRRSPEETQISS